METLIINKRHEMPKRKKFLWDGITVVLWGGWIYLWEPVILVLYKIVMLNAPVSELSEVIYDEVNAIPFDKAVFMLIATPIILFILSRLNRHLAPSEHLIYESDEYAAHFNVDHNELLKSLDSQFITVHHDEVGRITHLENKTLY